MRLFPQEMQQGVAPSAQFVYLGRDRAELAFGPHFVEVDRECAQQLLGYEVDRADVRGQKAADVALEEVGVADEHAAQPELYVESGCQPFVERGVRLDDPHPTADVRQVERVHDGLPLVGGAADIGILEPPREQVVDEVVGRPGGARPADGRADGLVTLKAHLREESLALVEETREQLEQVVEVGVPGGIHKALDHREKVHHHLVLAVAQRVVLEEEEADDEAVLDVLHPEDGSDGGVQEIGVGGNRHEPVAVTPRWGSRTGRAR